MTGKLAALAVTIEKARCYAMRWRLARRVPVSTNNSIEGPLLFYFVPPARYARWSLRLLEIKVGGLKIVDAASNRTNRADPYPLFGRPRETPVIRGDEGTIIVSTYAEIRVTTKG
jgi:hypothetical protein